MQAAGVSISIKCLQGAVQLHFYGTKHLLQVLLEGLY